MSETNEWFEIELNVPLELKDSLVNRLFELGAGGVSEHDDRAFSRVRGFFDGKHRNTVGQELPRYLDSVAELFPRLPGVEMALKEVAKENWATHYQQFYTAQKLSRSFFLKPVWDEVTPVPDRMIPIVMDAGEAFGTGLHASTQLSLGLLEVAIALQSRPAQTRLLDVGTGTGILSIGAAKLGVAEIQAIDVDPIAVDTAARNFELNHCPGIDVSDRPISQMKPPFDVIVSNILLETHRELAAEYSRLLKPRGCLILAGLLGPQRADIEMIFEKGVGGFIPEVWQSQQEWIAVLYIRSGG